VLALDVATPDEAAKLETLIDEEIAARVNDHKRGLRDLELADPSLVAERAFRNLAGYGQLRCGNRARASSYSWADPMRRTGPAAAMRPTTAMPRITFSAGPVSGIPIPTRSDKTMSVMTRRIATRSSRSIFERLRARRASLHSGVRPRRARMWRRRVPPSRDAHNAHAE
jgi:hypothetical protein